MKPDVNIVAPPLTDWGRVHFVGIGGAGMSALATLMLARGMSVSGSDGNDSAVLRTLRAAGARVTVGHTAENVAEADTVVVSTAIRESNPEVVAAKNCGCAVVHRGHALAALMADRQAIAVAGTHGKTTTTSMVTVALQAAGLDPSYAIGGSLVGTSISAAQGSGPIFVAESDESDGSFVLYSPQVAVVLNVEPDHLDHYGSAEAVQEAFADFAARVVPGGTLVACADDPGSAALATLVRQRQPQVHVVTYGVDPASDVQITDLEIDDQGWPVFRISWADSERNQGGQVSDPIRLQVRGVHNVRNATAAWAACQAVGAPAQGVAAGLAQFTGTQRRFETVAQVNDIRVIDDYAHHPTEVAAVLAAARAAVPGGRVHVIFQPHLYSRTQIFATEFALALSAADAVAVLDVYAAREDPVAGVSGALIADQLTKPGVQVRFEPDRAQAVQWVAEQAQPGDLIITMGAGDVTALGSRLALALAS